MMKNLVRKLVFALSVSLSAILFFAYYDFHFTWRNCFNEFGRCFDSETGVVYLEQSGILWLSLAVLATCVTLFQLESLIR